MGEKRHIYCKYSTDHQWSEGVLVCTIPIERAVAAPCEVHYNSFCTVFGSFGIPDFKDGLTFMLDVADVKVVLDEPTKIYKKGDRFSHHGDVYIIAIPEGGKASLISLQDGNRWSSPPARVENERAITEAEFDVLTGCQSADTFTLIAKEKDC